MNQPSTVGRYRIGAVLGTGGFGVVYRAYDPMLDRDVALKVLHTQFATDREFRQRFIREGRSLARVRHPNVVQVHDADDVGGTTYLAMELVAGSSVADLIEAHGPPPLAWTVAVADQVADALAAVHEANLIHRDIKPGNILVENMQSRGSSTPPARQRAVLLDLGIARDLDATVGGVSSVVMGTPSFMAPEQVMAGGDVTTQADVYQFGATIYAMLTGRPPFTGDPLQVIDAIKNSAPPNLAALRPDLPSGVTSAVMRALARQPHRRPPGPRAFADDLLRAFAGGAPASAPLGATPGPSRDGPLATAPTPLVSATVPARTADDTAGAAPYPTRPTAPPGAWKPPLPLVGSAIAIAIVLVGGVLAMRGRPPTSTGTASTLGATAATTTVASATPPPTTQAVRTAAVSTRNATAGPAPTPATTIPSPSPPPTRSVTPSPSPTPATTASPRPTTAPAGEGGSVGTGLTIQTEPARTTKPGQGVLRVSFETVDAAVNRQDVNVFKVRKDVRGATVKGDYVQGARTDNTGIATLDLPPDDYVVLANLPGYSWGNFATEDGQADVTITAGQQTTIKVRMGRLKLTVAAVDRAIENQYFYVLQQKRDINNTIVRGEHVSDERTGNTGVVTFDLTPGRYIVLSNLAGYNWGDFAGDKGASDVVVEAGRETVIDLRPGQLAVAVRNPSGGAAEGQYIQVYTQKRDTAGRLVVGDGVADGSTNNTGVWRTNLTPGSYAVRIGSGTKFDVVVDAGKVTELGP